MVAPPGVDARAVDGGAQSAARGQGADQPVAVDHRHDVDARGLDPREHLARVLHVRRVEGSGIPTRDVAQRGVGKGRGEAPGGHDAPHRGDVDDPVLSRDGHDDAPTGHRREDAAGIGDGRLGREDQGRVPGRRLGLDPRHGLDQILQRHVLRQHAEAAATRQGRREPRARDRVHVRRDERDRRPAAVGGGEVHVEAAAHLGMAGDEEHVRVRQVDIGLRAGELHGIHLTTSGECKDPKGVQKPQLG